VIELIRELCSDRCSGRKPGTSGGEHARSLIVDALRNAGLDAFEQPVPWCRGANVLAKREGNIDRWVLVGAHYDHLGSSGGETYWGADDNAAAVAILVEVAKGLASSRPEGRGVLLAAFDGEEPPHFLTRAMGSQYFVDKPTIPLDRIDLMVCMDLVGHALGPGGLPSEVRNTVFALGSERSDGTAAHVDRIGSGERGVVVRRADAEVIPPLSDYWAFWEARVPFLFLTNGRWRHYHTPEDTPEKLDYPKIAATARWLERFVRETCARPEPNIRFLPDGRDDASTLRSVIDVLKAMPDSIEEARTASEMATALLQQCDSSGRLSESARMQTQMLIAAIASRLA
jgi:hypothetical protein